jgi:hypothetical protein
VESAVPGAPGGDGGVAEPDKRLECVVVGRADGIVVGGQGVGVGGAQGEEVEQEQGGVVLSARFLDSDGQPLEYGVDIGAPGRTRVETSEMER